MTTTRKKATSTPDDKPFDFNLDALEAEADLSPFRVHFQGRRWELAHMEELDAWDVLAAAQEGEARATYNVFRLGLGEQFDDFRKLRLPQWRMKALFKAWQAHCGLAEGESLASFDS